MFGIPLMFMCLTYTGDLLADAFISGYSKLVNFSYRQIRRSRLRNFLNYRRGTKFQPANVNVFFFHHRTIDQNEFAEKERRKNQRNHRRIFIDKNRLKTRKINFLRSNGQGNDRQIFFLDIEKSFLT